MEGRRLSRNDRQQGNKVDVLASERLLRGRSAVSKGGRAKGPTADDHSEGTGLPYWLALYAEGVREGGTGATVYQAIVTDLRNLPAGAREADISRVIGRYEYALRDIA